MTNKELVEKCLAALGEVAEIRKRLGEVGTEARDLFETAFKEAITAPLENAEAAEAVKAALEGNAPASEVSDPDLFASCQDEAVALAGDWTEEASQLAVAAYLAQGGKLEAIDDPNRVCTLGELYGLESTDPEYAVEAKLTSGQRKGLPGGSFCGPNRSFPVHDKAHAVAALRLLGRYKGPGDKETIRKCIVRKAAKFGVGPGAKKEAYSPIVIQIEGECIGNKCSDAETFMPIRIESVEELSEAKTNLSVICETFGFSDELQESAKKFVEELEKHSDAYFNESCAPLFVFEQEAQTVVLGHKFLFEYFVRHEGTDLQREYLSKLVGLVRKRVVSLDTIEAAGKPYSVFGVSVLKKLLTAPAPADPDKDKGSESDKGTEKSKPVEQVPNPILEGASEPPKEGEQESHPALNGLTEQYASPAVVNRANRKNRR